MSMLLYIWFQLLMLESWIRLLRESFTLQKMYSAVSYESFYSKLWVIPAKLNKGTGLMFSKLLQIFTICFYERSISWKFQLHSSIQSHFMAIQIFRDCPKISSLQISLIFRDSFSQIAFAVRPTGAISWTLTKNSFKNI